MTDLVILAQFFAIVVIVAVAIALFLASLSNSENWPKAGWGGALALEAARRAIMLFWPDLARDAPVPPDTVQFLVMACFFIAATAGRGRHTTRWVAGGLAASAVAAMVTAYRPEFAALFAPAALILAGVVSWRWRRSAMVIAAIAVFGWGGLDLAMALGIHDAIEPTAMTLTTGFLATVSGLAVFTDLVIPGRHARIRSFGTRRRPGQWRGAMIATGEAGGDPEETYGTEEDDTLEHRIEETTLLLDTTLSSMAEGLVAVGADSRILLLNDALRRFLDLNDTPDLAGKDLTGEEFENILLTVAQRGDLGPGDPISVADEFLGRIMGMAESQEPAFEWTLPDGRTCLVSCDQLPGGGLISTFTDVTEQRNTLRIMAQARDAAERGNKAKTEFLTRMSHELRTPLNSIIGFAGMLRNEVLGPIGVEDYRGFADNIGASGQTLLSQINAILDVARLEAGTLGLTESIIDLRAVLEAAIVAAKSTASVRGIGFSYYLAPDLPAIRADEHRLGQILAHLFDNALKFSPSGSQIIVRALADPFEGVTILVSDQGIGMTDEQVNSAFEPFAQADTALDRQFQGAGLGLSLVKGLVDLHRGKITVASVPNQGTTVSVTLPPERIVLDL